MYIFFIVLILIASILLILAVLAQSPKSGMAANFGASNPVSYTHLPGPQQSPQFQQPQPQQPRQAMPGQRPVQPSGNIPPRPAVYQQPVQQGGRPQPGCPQSQGQPVQPQQPVQSPVPHPGQQTYGGAPQYAPQLSLIHI